MVKITSLIILLLLIFKSQSLPTGCQVNEWQCLDGMCIPDNGRCDNFPDCDDGSDEQNCTVSPVCLEGLESCPQPNGTTVCVSKAIGCSCGSIQDIAHGTIVSDNDTIGSIANVSCDTGYGASSVAVTCQVTGLWETAICIPKECGPAAKIAFGKIDLSDINNTTYGSTGKVVCDTGYETLTPVIRCQASGNWDTAVCTVKDCRSPSKIKFGNITLNHDKNSTYGATAVVTCDSGYYGNLPEITCQSSGIWENASCSPKDCGNVPKLDFGKLILNDHNNTLFGASATVMCATGYERTIAQVNCQSSGIWETAICNPKYCGFPSAIAFGNITLNDKNNTTYGATAVISCYDNYAATLPMITCESSGRWDNATCISTGCGPVPKLSHGRIVLTGNHSTGSNASVICDVGYASTRPSVTCQLSGDWETAECTPQNCGPVPAIAFGNITLADSNNTTFGASAHVVCDADYETKTSNVTCLDTGLWEMALCAIKDCGPAPAISFGDTSLTDASNTTVEASANVKCNTGYEANVSKILCQSSGIWKIAVCKPKDCGPLPVIEFGNISLSKDNNSTIGAKAVVTCRNNYAASTPIIKCQSSGVWENVTCFSIGCGFAPKLPHGMISFTKSSTGSSAVVRCDIGYQANVSSVMCKSSGLWETASCTAKDCGPPPRIAFGNATLSEANKSTFGSTAFVRCNAYYTTGTPNITCQPSGTWQNATCFPKGCSSLPGIHNGKRTLIGNATVGSLANVICDAGYVASIPFVMCQMSGFWEKAYCTPKGCGPPPTISNGNITLRFRNKSTFGDEASVHCDDKYFANVSRITCQSSGAWEAAKCIPESKFNYDRCTEEHGICTQPVYEHVRLRALKSSKCKTFCHCAHAATLPDGSVTYKWVEHNCPSRTLFDENLPSPVCNHDYMVWC